MKSDDSSSAILPSQRVRSVLVRKKGHTDPSYGTEPEKRSMERHLRLGAINLDKTSGPTSHEVVAWVKRILEVEKAGHSGTLDPRVTGVLPVLLGDATRVMDTLLTAGKEYICLMRVHGAVPRKRVLEVCQQFTGEIYQRPPLKSSVAKVLRTRKIYYLQVLEIDGPRVLMRVGCEAGTYIRKLCFDMGLVFGTGANMEELRRTRAGPFSEDEGLVTLHQLKDAYLAWREGGDEGALRQAVFPVERAISHLPRLVIADSAVDAICHGSPLAAPGLLSLETDINQGDVVAMYTLKGEAVAVGKAAMDSGHMHQARQGLVVSTERVIMETGIYPRRWKMQPGQYRR
ncbi:MAG: putative tRNA pseudouridine synthase B [Methanosaeta sp. PtaB.Bin039]|nr:MAG: putative tRNA pseudouridine synthase B [Methanosaeta sp. PtaB.Bin039]HOT07498.1 RNA-guided pseudouridylation complex pseudouridine synthase subunit Cbf5 [Methanotrichaceae archaeon]HQF16977.1 RNA-guided pseudouridylation complex pseudouridine synthase subunit Cbf5 [Methanotrichaceae archaeon]HQI91597.1 RNA-guided pseudouridylation complex pseudouridine synthase subunit Cbf5 [Methanotrichaceae archaeon]HQJ28909.1 RNA-guided pseudouridylation complex pseudouridine synthase subunit Cbf5 [M